MRHLKKFNEDLYTEPEVKYRNTNNEIQIFIDEWIPEYAGEDILIGFVSEDGTIRVSSIDKEPASQETWEGNAEDILSALYDEGWRGYELDYIFKTGFELKK
jgi:hypothetical protein